MTKTRSGILLGLSLSGVIVSGLMTYMSVDSLKAYNSATQQQVREASQNVEEWILNKDPDYLEKALSQLKTAKTEWDKNQGKNTGIKDISTLEEAVNSAQLTYKGLTEGSQLSRELAEATGISVQTKIGYAQFDSEAYKIVKVVSVAGIFGVCFFAIASVYSTLDLLRLNKKKTLQTETVSPA